MGIFDRIAARIGYTRKGYESGNLAAFLGIGTSSVRDMQLNKGWVYAAVHAISEAMANIDFILYEKKSDGTVAEVKEHALLDLLDGVNPTMTGYELKHRTGSHLELAGNAYWLLYGANGKPVNSDTEAPTAVYPLNPSKITIDRGDFPELVRLYKYTDKASTIPFQPHQILHLKYPNPSDDVLGLAPVEALRSWIETDQNAADFQRVYFQNGAKVGGILKSKNTLTRDQIELLRAQWQETQQGLRNAHKPVILPSSLEYQDITKSQQEMDFVNSLNELRDKILAGLRVPKTILGNAEGSTNRATAETATYVFALYTIKPKMKLITAYLNEFLVPRFGDNLFLAFKDPVPENKDVELQELGAAMGTQGILTINEARSRYLGLGPIKGGDNIMAPVTTQPVASNPPQESAAGTPTENQARSEVSTKGVETSGKPFRTQHARNAEKRREIARAVAVAALAVVKEKIKQKDITQLSDEEYGKIWQAKIARITGFEKKQADVLRKVNETQKKEVLRKLPTAIKRAKAVDADKLMDRDKYVKIIVDASVPIQTALFEQEGLEAAKLIGIEDIDLLTPAVQEAINKSMTKMAESYTDTTIDLLKGKIEQGIEDGSSLDEMSGLVDDVYEFSDLTRADSVARTETTRISNDAKVSAWEQSGIVGSKTWYTAEDERVCTYCDAMNGTNVALGDNFVDEGDGIDGSDGTSIEADYSDIGGPPAHVNCRCDLRPDDINS